MKTCYIENKTRSIADLARPGELHIGWTICRINVLPQHRGLGHGSRLLDTICADADREGVDLYLHPVPSGPLDRDDLIAFYKRRGFKVSYDGYMRRRPRA